MSPQTMLRLEDIQRLVNIGQADQPVEVGEPMLDDDFDDLGVDSLALIELADRVQEAYHVPIDDEDVANLRTPRKLLDYVNSRLYRRDS